MDRQTSKSGDISSEASSRDTSLSRGGSSRDNSIPRSNSKFKYNFKIEINIIK